jgi:hypothetical protein
MRQVIDDVFDDNLVREKRKKWVEHASFSNPSEARRERAVDGLRRAGEARRQ